MMEDAGASREGACTVGGTFVGFCFINPKRDVCLVCFQDLLSLAFAVLHFCVPRCRAIKFFIPSSVPEVPKPRVCSHAGQIVCISSTTIN